jgi:hypothetical protein
VDPAELRARAAECGLSVSEYVAEELRRAEREAAWERALAALEPQEDFGCDPLPE